jgi:hypothetical protein
MTKLALKEMWDALGDCWTQEFGELELTVNHTLTEPTCPTAIIATERDAGPRWRADQDTIDDAIYAATAAAYITIVRREPKPMTFPVSDSNEEKRVADFLTALDKRRAEKPHPHS